MNGKQQRTRWVVYTGRVVDKGFYDANKALTRAERLARTAPHVSVRCIPADGSQSTVAVWRDGRRIT